MIKDSWSFNADFERLVIMKKMNWLCENAFVNIILVEMKIRIRKSGKKQKLISVYLYHNNIRL